MADDNKTPPADTKPGMKLGEVREQAAKGELFSHIAKDEHVAHKELVTQIRGLEEKAKTLKDAELTAAHAEIGGLKTKAAEMIKGVSESRYKEFGNLSFTQKLGARVSGNFNVTKEGLKTSKWSKFGRGASVGLGSLLVGKGIKDLVAPQRDEKGENQTGFLVPLVEVVGGGAAVYFAALHGGADKAMGLGLK